MLLDQQFWFLGHDIRHTAGNGLERYGFRRFRAVDGVGTTCYVLPLEPGRALVCWGFAAYVGAVCETATADGPVLSTPAGVLVQRHSVTPRLVCAAPALPLHRLADLPRARAPHSRRDWQLVHEGLQQLAIRFAEYEQWAQRALGEPYRLGPLRALPRHKRRKFEPVSDLSGFWARWRQ
ncbi:MAG: hypothetical protein ACKODA_05545 [Nevskiaceae bacterium]